MSRRVEMMGVTPPFSREPADSPQRLRLLEMIHVTDDLPPTWRFPIPMTGSPLGGEIPNNPVLPVLELKKVDLGYWPWPDENGDLPRRFAYVVVAVTDKKAAREYVDARWVSKAV